MLATWFYRNAIRPGLFLLDPEDAHDLVANLLPASVPMLSIAKEAIFSERVQAALPRLTTTLANNVLANPVGVAAGLDKNAKFVSIWPQRKASLISSPPRPGNRQAYGLKR